MRMRRAETLNLNNDLWTTLLLGSGKGGDWTRSGPSGPTAAGQGRAASTAAASGRKKGRWPMTQRAEFGQADRAATKETFNRDTKKM